jgi:valyl-tRNA synthetase
LFLLQSTVIEHSDDQPAFFSFDQYDRFIQKWRNISRIIPIYNLSIIQLQQKIQDNTDQLNDYDRYFITKIHELYDEVVFLQSKNHISQIINLIVSTLRYEISDLLLYVLKKKSSSMTEMV